MPRITEISRDVQGAASITGNISGVLGSEDSNLDIFLFHLQGSSGLILTKTPGDLEFLEDLEPVLKPDISLLITGCRDCDFFPA